MSKNKYLTNQELLTELEKRLPNFTQDEFVTLIGLLAEYPQEFQKSIQVLNPQAHQWIQKKAEEYEQEKTDKKAEQLTKSLEK